MVQRAARPVVVWVVVHVLLCTTAGVPSGSGANPAEPGRPSHYQQRPSKTYRLSESISVEAFAPVLVVASHHRGQFVWYPKTLAWLGRGRLLLSHSTQADAANADGLPLGVRGEILTSGDNGQSWQHVERQPVYGTGFPGLTHCQPPDAAGISTCMADETSFWQPAGTANVPRDAIAVLQRFNASTGAYLGSGNSSWKFAHDLGTAAANAATHFEMDMDGSVVQVPSASGADDGKAAGGGGGLLASSYGPFRGGNNSRSNCSVVNATWSGVHNGVDVICTSVVVSRSDDGGEYTSSRRRVDCESYEQTLGSNSFKLAKVTSICRLSSNDII